MADQSSTYSRIYDLKSVGADKVVSQINAITSAFEKLARIKKGISFDDLTNGIGDNVSAVTSGLTKIQSAYEQTADTSEKAAAREEAARERQMRKLDEASAREALALQRHIELLQRKQEALERQAAKEEAALKRLENDYEILKQAYKDASDKAKMLGATFGTNSDVFKRAAYEANKMHEVLLRLERSVGQSQRNVGNYNGAVMAMSQILREMPSFAYSAATGLLAVSNNIPILADEIKKLNEANNQLRANGERTIPVWKTLMQAIISPTGLITTVTAIVTILAARIAMAGNESEKASEKVNNFEQALKSLKETIESLNFNISAGIEEEVTKAQRLVEVYHSINATAQGRINAYNDLQSLYPKILGSLSDEEIKTKKISAAHEEQMQKLREVISLKVKVNEVDKAIGANIKVIAAARDQMEKMNAEMTEGTINAINRAIKAQGDGLNHPIVADPAAGVDEAAANKYLDYRDKILRSEKSIGFFKQAQLEYAVKLANIENNPDRENKTKKERDYTNERIAANKSLLDAKYELESIEIQMEATKQKNIFDNEKNSYEIRLQALELYTMKQRELLRVTSQKEMDEVDSKLGEIDRIKGISPDKRTAEQNTLLLSEDALLAQREVIAKKWEQERLNQEIAHEKGITSIKTSEAQKRLDAQKKINEQSVIDEDNALAELREKLDDSAISYDAYVKKKEKVETEFQRKRLQALKAYLEMEMAEMEKLGADTSKFADAIKAVDHQLNELNLNAAERNAKKTQAVFKQATDQLFSFAQSAGQAYIDLLAKQDAAQQSREDKQMERTKKRLDASAQSLRERDNFERSFDLAQEQREHAKAEKAKERAESELKFQYAVAVMKAVAAHVGDFGIGAGIEIGGMTAIFGAQLAMLEAAPAYAQGTNGSHPGGLAWVGDGYEHEFAKINNSWFVTPNTPTLTNLPAGSEVVPFSKVTSYSGTMGSQVQAPSFYSNRSGSGGGDNAASFEAIHNALQTVVGGLANMRVTLDTQATGRAINNGYYKKTHL